MLTARSLPALNSRLLLAVLFAFPVYSADRIQAPSSRQGIVLFRVDADAKTIWSVIRDFESYPLWIEALTETEIYHRETDLIYVWFSAQHWLAGNTSWYAIHHFPANRDWGTWQLDSTKKSDLAASTGFWLVLPVADQPGRSDVVYSVEV